MAPVLADSKSQNKTTCTFLFYLITCGFLLSGLYSAPARLVGNSRGPSSLLSVLNRLPLVVHLVLLYKKPQPLLCRLPAFNISPRLSIVILLYTSQVSAFPTPLKFPSPTFLVESHRAGWLVIACFFSMLFSAPSFKKQPKHYHTCPNHGLSVATSSP